MVKKAAQATPNTLLRAARKERGWTQQQVADRIGAPLSLNISRWESGTSFPSAYYIEKLCHVFGKSVRELGLSQLEDETLEEPRAHSMQKHDFIHLPKRSLPLALTPLIGREEEANTLQALVQRSEVRLLTLTGAGGIGKTRLALHVASRLQQEFADGIFCISLAALNEPEHVLATIAQILDLKEDIAVSPYTLLKTSLYEKRILLLLDNFERLLSAAPDLLELLLACPQLKILVTSRAVLHVQGEYEFPVPPLALPNLAHLPEPLILAQYSAIALFLQRSQAVKHDFHLTEVNAQAVAEICVRLDGLPLALELAAARIKLLSPQELLARLGNRLAVLTGGSQDLPQRQRTLRDTILWSYQLLQDQEQRFLQRFSLFSGGCTLETLEAVCAALDIANECAPKHLLEVVTSLLDKSLLQIVQQEGKQSRLHMLEVIREYGLECLQASGEMEQTRAAHSRYFLQFAIEVESKLWSPEHLEWLEQLEQEHNNLRAALSWSLDARRDRGRQQIALCLSVALRSFWSIRGYLSEGRAFLERALTQAEDVEAHLLIRAFLAAGYHANEQGDFDQAEIWGKKSLALSSEMEDAQGFTYSLMLLGNIAMKRGENAEARLLLEEGLARFKGVSASGRNYGLISLANVFINTGKYDQAYPLLEEALAGSKETGFVPAIVEALNLLARIALYQGDFLEARTLLEESLILNRKVNYQDGAASALMTRGLVSLVEGELAAARSSLEAGLILSRKGGWQERTAWGIYGLGWVAYSEKDYQRALLFFEEGLTLCRRLSNQVFIAFYLEGFSATAVMQGQFAWAARLWGGAHHLREEIGAAVPPFMRSIYEHFVKNMQLQLGEEMFVLLQEQGRTMTLDQLLCNKLV